MAKEIRWENLFPRMQYTVYQAIDAYRRSIAPSLKTKQGVALLPESGLPCYAAPRIKTASMDVHAETSALIHATIDKLCEDAEIHRKELKEKKLVKVFHNEILLVTKNFNLF